ncbi:MAG: type II secretion system F family protein [Gammaproteobacteria bacterium]
MPRFRYKAVAPGGEIVEGEADAASRQALIDRLHASGHTPLRAAAVDGGGRSAARVVLARRRGLGRRDVLELTSQLATLIGAGLDLDRALTVMLDVGASAPRMQVLERLRRDIRAGSALSQSLAAQGALFSRFYVNMVRAGEAGGVLAEVLQRLAQYLERAQALRDGIRGALLYPAILLAVAALSMLVLLTVVLPQFRDLFAQMDAQLPLLTRIVLACGDALRHWGWLALLAVGAAGAWLAWRLEREPHLQLHRDRLLLRLPLIGQIVLRAEVARFARTLGTLLGSGVTLITALAIVRETMTNRVLAELIGAAADRIRQGGGLSEPLRAANVLPAQAIHLIRVGEETGELDRMLLRIADIYDNEVAVAVRHALAVLEPALIVLLALGVAIIVLSLLLAILGVNDLPV